jgi:hypothetical protein
MSDPVTLLIHCAHCHDAVTLQFEDWQPDGSAADRAQRWLCPSCFRINEGTFPAVVKWFTRGYRPGPYA